MHLTLAWFCQVSKKATSRLKEKKGKWLQLLLYMTEVEKKFQVFFCLFHAVALLTWCTWLVFCHSTGTSSQPCYAICMKDLTKID